MDLLGKAARICISQNILPVVKYTQFCTVTQKSIINKIRQDPSEAYA